MSRIKSTFRGNKKAKKLIPNLTASPNHVCFKDYEEGKAYKSFVQIVNHDLRTYHVGIKFDSPHELRVRIVGNSSKTLLTSGDDITLEVEFLPTVGFKREFSDRRYEICISVVNANARFYIPILILSPHPELNVPREITLPDTALNTPAYSNIFVLNYTSAYTKFSFECRSGVKIIPDTRVLGVKSCEGATYLIELTPKTMGSFREKIFICLDNDKRFTIALKCNVVPVNIFLNEVTVDFSPTFIGMSDRKRIHIVNNSETPSLFEWLLCESQSLEAHPSPKCIEIAPMSGELQSGTITAVDFTFKPEDIDDEFEIMKSVFVSFALRLSVTPHYSPSVIIKGAILGPSFQLDKRCVDLHELFPGESRSVDVTVTNTGIIGGKILLQRPAEHVVRVLSATAYFLKPGESKSFKLEFLAKRIGRFMEQVFFKVKNGERLSLTIQGAIKALNVLLSSDSVKCPVVPICVPQIHFLKLTNPLSFDIDVSVECEENGTEDPLEFPEFYRQHEKRNASAEVALIRTSIGNFLEHSGKMSQLCGTFSSTQQSLKMIFENATAYLERMEIVESIVRTLFDDRRECDIVVETILELLIGSISDGGDFEKFYEKKWNFPKNPRQISCSETRFRLPAGASNDLKVFLTPNHVGKFTRCLKIHLSMSECHHQERTDQSVKSVPISFECHGAEIKIYNFSNEISGYAESEIPLEILIENVSAVDGFFRLDPQRDTQMEVRCAEGKFHIPAGAQKVMGLQVTPLMSGQIIKYVSVIALGSNRKFPICIECKSLPPDIVVKPSKIVLDDLDVLTRHETRIFIENRSHTKARFFLKFEQERDCFSTSPSGGILSSKQCVIVMLEKFFHDPGEYKGVLLVEIVNSKVIKVPIKCTVRRLPILIEPSQPEAVDFGTLFVSKSPYFLEYKFINGGKHSYMVFLMLKNVRKRSDIINFSMEPKRFELAPNCSQVVKFLLNAEHASYCGEQFAVEGCSIHYPVRELIWESKLKASVIRPTINFTRSELIFNCYYGAASRLSLPQTIDIVSKSDLPLPVTLKVEGEFSLEPLERKVMFSLKAHECREIHVCFDANLIKSSNEFRTYEGTVKAYSLGKLQCTLKLIANLIYPEIELSTNEVQFTANVLPCAHSFVISNPNQLLPASFCFSLCDDATKIVTIRERRQENLLNVVQCLMRQTDGLREKFFRHDDNDDVSPSCVDKKSQAIDGVEVTSKEILKHLEPITGRKRSESNRCSDMNETMMTPATDGSFLSLSQMSGVLQPNERRLISLYFSGSRNAFDLSTIIKCVVEGGIERDIRLRMTNCNPNVVVTKTQQQQRWQEITINSVCISNVSPAPLAVRLIAETGDVGVSELIEGYVKPSSRSQLNFTLDDERHFCCDLRFSMFAGCLPVFKSEFGVQVNEKPPLPVTFVCHNPLPTANLLDIDRKSLATIEKAFEYDCLRDMFNRRVDRTRVADEDVTCDEVLRVKARLQALEDEQRRKIRKKSIRREPRRKMTSIDALSSGDCDSGVRREFELSLGNECGRVVWRERPQRMYSAKVLQMADASLDECGFVTLDYPDEYPRALQIVHFIAQCGFVKSLESNETFMMYKSIYNRHAVERFRRVKKSLAHSRGPAVVLDDVVAVETLPLISLEYSYDFGEIRVGERYEKTVQVFFHHHNGFPVAAALRSTNAVAGLSVSFHQRAEINNLFEIKNYECVESCHSLDLTTERSPQVFAEIFQRLPFEEQESRFVEFKITFTPTCDDYGRASALNEMIYLDINLGPQLPLRITAQFNHCTDEEEEAAAEF